MMSCLYRNDSLAASYSHRGKPPTTIGAEELNFRVRHGNGCDLFAIATKPLRVSFKTKQDRERSVYKTQGLIFR